MTSDWTRTKAERVRNLQASLPADVGRLPAVIDFKGETLLAAVAGK